MRDSGRQEWQAWGPPPAPARPPAPGRRLAPARPRLPLVDDGVVLAALRSLVRAPDATAVGDAVLVELCERPGVRAGLLAAAPRHGADPVVLASRGYGCAEMATGAALPLLSGLPVTEAARTGRAVVQGDPVAGPAWVALPVRPGAALLLSLAGPPPPPGEVAVLAVLATSIGQALTRAERDAQARSDLAVLEQGLVPVLPSTPGLACRSRPFCGALSGDVVAHADGGSAAAARWLLVADVRGCGHLAAVAADRLRAAFLGVAPLCSTPAQVLAGLDRSLGVPGEESFATALVVRVEGERLLLASAGHPAPLAVAPGTVPRALALVPGAPLALGLDVQPPADAVGMLRADELLLAWTDGLTDRGADVELDALVTDVSAGLPDGASPDLVADAILAATAALGPAQDDETLVAWQPTTR